MDFNEYFNKAKETAVYPEDVADKYLLLGIAGEAGEMLNAFKKYLRGDYDKNTMMQKVSDEAGDVLWYLCMVADVICGKSLEEIAIENINKLADRKRRDQIHGYGAHR